MANPLEILPGRLSQPRQIPIRLLLGIRGLNDRQQPGPEQLEQLDRIPTIRLDMLAPFDRNQRRRDHLAVAAITLDPALVSL